MAIEYNGKDVGLFEVIFLSFIRIIDKQFLEGDPIWRIVKRDIELETQFEAAGMAVAYSVLQEGPGSGSSCPPLFHYILHANIDRCLTQKSLVSVNDIPLGTAGLVINYTQKAMVKNC